MTKITKAPVDVVMPEVKLTIADLAYMTGLMPGGTRCYGDNKIKDRLIFLGLIEEGMLPPCPKAVAEHHSKEMAARAAITAAIKVKDWDEVFRVGGDWHYSHKRAPKEETGKRLTASGMEFMTKGRARVITSTKGGCLK